MNFGQERFAFDFTKVDVKKFEEDKRRQIEQLVSMGFDYERAKRALESTGDLESAVNFLLQQQNSSPTREGTKKIDFFHFIPFFNFILMFNFPTKSIFVVSTVQPIGSNISQSPMRSTTISSSRLQNSPTLATPFGINSFPEARRRVTYFVYTIPVIMDILNNTFVLCLISTESVFL